ncbi:DUF726-domain-containing protein [Macrolepiota fuliginosa MF-IS2]|uniref:DUF726-domain-containing protein n=1 Tax=Macrolepiota fuliginosa MF-IS2 TaxID=1400762 RepID=A0A9P6C2V8_9AGAR|nr:DUF726-domain-containing protein [Macrolepiota fuliginosa MF-IS2]
MPVTTAPPPSSNIFDDDDDDGWQDMPVIRDDHLATDLDEEDRKKYHYQAPSTTTSKSATNATGNHIDVDDWGNEWRSKLDQNENEYTRLRVQEEDDHDEVHLRTRYLFDEDKAMTPLSQMQATKKLLTEAQRIAYVGLCALTAKEMVQALRLYRRKELKASVSNMELWALKIMGRIYYHMELETPEQKMIENLAEHGVQAMDLVPSLMTTHTVANPEYDPEEARRRTEQTASVEPDHPDLDDSDDISVQTLVEPPSTDTPKPESPGNTPQVPPTPTSSTFNAAHTNSNPTQTTAKVLGDTTTHMPGVTTSLSSADENVTLDIRWTVLCDLFLILIADSVYDARSRVLLERVAEKLGLGWLDVVRFESRVTEALEIQEDIEKLEQQEIVDGVQKAGKRRRYMMMGLATLGGGLVIGLSAGLLAPVIGVGLAGAFSAIGITGTGVFLGGTAGAAAITTGGVLTGSTIAARGMAKRTREVRTFDILPLHNNKRVNCILTVSGFMNGTNDDVRLPFSVLDPIVGDVFSVLWEPEMIRETGSALKIMTSEVLSQVGLTILQATAMTTLMTALQWPIILTKLGYLIDNPWSNALDRAKAAGRVLADVLIQRHLGVRPITLIGFSLGARVIFYALLELSRQKAYGIVQDVFLLGATLTASQSTWCETRAAVSGRYVNAYARNDWVLNYLFRASSGGIGTVAGLRPVQNVPGLENVDVTGQVSGHMSYRTFMPLILDQLGFPVSADYFDEPEVGGIVVREDEKQQKKSWFGRRKPSTQTQHASRPPTASSYAKPKAPSTAESTAAPAGGAIATATAATQDDDDDDLPPRMESPMGEHKPRTSSDITASGSSTPRIPTTPTKSASTPATEEDVAIAHIPKHAGFNLTAMRDIVGQAQERPSELDIPASSATSNFRSKDNSSLGPRTQVVESRAEAKRSVSVPVPVRPTEVMEDERNGLAREFAKSFSLKGEPVSRTQTNPFGSGSYRSQDSLSSKGPALRFEDAFDTPAWGPSASTASSPPIGATTAGGRGADAYVLGGYRPSFASSSMPSGVQNPFATSSYSPSLNDYGYNGAGGFSGGDAGLSFGSSDGTITNSSGGGFGGHGDPWAIPGDLGKKSSGASSTGFSSNPWS